MKATLNLHLLVDEGQEANCAAALHQRLEPNQFRVLTQLASEIVARWETVHSGQRLVVIAAAEAEAEIQKHLRLRPTAPVAAD